MPNTNLFNFKELENFELCYFPLYRTVCSEMENDGEECLRNRAG